MTSEQRAAQAGPPGMPAGVALTIDALGKKCPIPIIMLAERIREVAIGEIIAVLADDPAAKSDLPAWCRLKSQEYLETREIASGWALLVRRSY